MATRHFLTLDDFSRDELYGILRRAIELKRLLRQGERVDSLQGRVLAMLFEKSSTRTRVSFAAGMAQLGGQALDLDAEKTQLTRGEPIEDTARVLSELVDAVLLRTFEQARLERMAEVASVPIINGLSDDCHPCQLLADLLTWIEHHGELGGRVAVWLGDGNNVCQSWMDAARIMDFELRVVCPEGYAPDAGRLAAAGANVCLHSEPEVAVRAVDVLVTDVWASMGQEQEQSKRARVFAPYQVNARLMELARPDALFMHCLPAHRGEEVSAEVLDGPQSVVWEEAGNRLHAQKALLEFLIGHY